MDNSSHNSWLYIIDSLSFIWKDEEQREPTDEQKSLQWKSKTLISVVVTAIRPPYSINRRS